MSVILLPTSPACNLDTEDSQRLQSVWGHTRVVQALHELVHHTPSGAHYCIALAFHEGIDGPVIEKLFAQFYGDQYLMDSQRGLQCLRTISIVLNSIAQSVASHQAYGETFDVRYVRSPVYFAADAVMKRRNVRHQTSAMRLVEVLTFFEELGWISLHDTAANKASTFAVNYGVIPSLDTFKVRVPGGALVYVKYREDFVAKNGRAAHRSRRDMRGPIAKMVPFAAALHQDLDFINENALRFSYVTYAGDEAVYIPAAEFMSVAIYNDRALTSGGRLYCPALNMPEGEGGFRSRLHVNGKATVEVDFKSLHIGMLYNRAGVEAPDDCYAVDIPGWTAPADVKRSLLKLVVLALPNCGGSDKDAAANRRSAVSTTRETYAEWVKKNRRHALPAGMKTTHILDCVIAAHPIIADSFYSGQGIYLQALDGTIARRVMLYFAKLGKFCMGVHDSFRVVAEDLELLQERMRVEYEALLGFTPITTVTEAVPVPAANSQSTLRAYALQSSEYRYRNKEAAAPTVVQIINR